MSQYSIITSEGWTETMYETMRAAGENEEFHFYTYFMPIYFIFSHMFGSLVKNRDFLFIFLLVFYLWKFTIVDDDNNNDNKRCIL